MRSDLGAGGQLESVVLASLVGQICHDLNNHLATLLGKTEVALMVNDPARYRPALEQALEAGQPARAVVAELQRVMTWLRDGETDLPVCDAIGTAVRLCERACAKRRVEIALVNRSPGLATRDPGRVALTCWSLLHRALEGRPADRERPGETWSLESWAEPGGIGLALEACSVGHEPQGLAELSELLGLLGVELHSAPGRLGVAIPRIGVQQQAGVPQRAGYSPAPSPPFDDPGSVSASW